MSKPNIYILISIVLIFIIAAGCGEKAPSYQLELSSFRLNMSDLEPDKYFARVIDIDVTPQGEIVIVDIDAPGILRFDSSGRFVNDIYAYGGGSYEGLCSVTPADTLLAVHTIGLLEFFRRSGKPVKHHYIRGAGDVLAAHDGSFVINRMYDSFRMGHCLESYEESGKLISKFRAPECSQEGEQMLDFAFTGFTPDNNIIYIPAVKDSALIYDFQGNLILAKKLKSKFKPHKAENGSPVALIEDVYVDEDGIFIVRIIEKMSDENAVFFDLIEQYDFDFNRIASYKFANPLTMTVPTDPYSPWYHKFCHKDGIFYFMLSQPIEQLMAFVVKK